MNKKADMSIQVIVKAVIAIVVMIILISVFSNHMQRQNNNLTRCSLTTGGGKCAADCSAIEGGTYEEYSGDFSDCTGENIMCCIPR